MTPLNTTGRQFAARLLPVWRKLRTPVLWTLAIAYFSFAAILLSLRYVVLPNIADYRGDLEQVISNSLDLPVSIAEVRADWRGLRPQLTLVGLKISDKRQRPALAFDTVDAVIGWKSLLYLDLRLHRLQLDAPELAMRREEDGQIYIAGLAVNTATDESRFASWVLAQEQIVINKATISWHDAKRKAPPLRLTNANLNLKNSGDRHQFALTAQPPDHLAARIEVRGDFDGSDLDALETWTGQVYAELEYADLAVWRRWVDYPIDLARGTGAIRMWLDVAQKEISSATMDLLLADVNVRFGKGLPVLDLRRLQGRLIATQNEHEQSFEAVGLSLATYSGITVPNTDFRFALWHDEAGNPNRIEARATRLNLGKISALAGYLPVPQRPRELLEQTRASGELHNFSMYWDTTGDYTKYDIRAEFNDLGMAAHDAIPGARHLSGVIAGNHDAGEIRLFSKNAEVDLPRVFAESRIGLDNLDAKLRWQRKGKDHVVFIDDMRFSNTDAEGSLKGSYVAHHDKAGEADLSARVSRASGTAVWKYLPLSVNKETRDWVKRGITAGRSSDVQLVLKGDLDKFPFRGGDGGEFKVLVKAQGVSVIPAAGWPQIDNIDGDLAFIGERMQIDARSGKLMGVQVSDVRAQIADLESETDQMLVITGKAKGETQAFLNFIEASPVAARINNFTTPMQAKGNGELDLKLNLALHHMDASSLEGRYRFDANELSLNKAMPPLTDLHGELRFTGDSMSLREGRGNMLGAPLNIDIATSKAGFIEVQADGQVNVTALKKLYALPVFDHLAGGSKWKGRLTIRKNDVDFRITSDLVGLASSLPEPFAKSATTPMELRFERKILPPEKGKRSVQREQSEFVLGKLVRGQALRIFSTPENVRGYIQIGSSDGMPLPAKNVLLSASLPKMDLDYWRSMFEAPASAAVRPSVGLPFTQLDLRTSELVFMNRTLRDVRLAATQAPNRNWRADFRSKGVQAVIDWWPAADGKPGRIVGRIPQLVIPDPNQQITPLVSVNNESFNQLPNLSLAIDHLSLKGQDWGAVTLETENRVGELLSKFSVNNDDGSLVGDAKWRPAAGQNDTQLNFQLKAKSVEKLLVRAGYVDAVKRGTATLDGVLSWKDTPFNIDYPSLGGKLTLDAQNGQFKKLEPGLGRLLGVMSLQSLPRRVNLDFRDIFSDGFAFDSIKGEAKVSQGAMQTDLLQIAGPSAKIRLSGSVNLPQETQDLSVKVQPALGDTVSVGVMLAMANPVVGAATWLANQALKNPIDQMFAFEYKVTGSWSDPQVARVNTGRDINEEIKREVAKETERNKAREAEKTKEAEKAKEAVKK